MKHGKYRKALEAFEQIQTTSLLASRDFMYAHAQLDFESRLLKGTTDERKTLAERLDISAISLPVPHFSVAAVQANASGISSPRLNRVGSPDLLVIEPVQEPRDSHQQSGRFEVPGANETTGPRSPSRCDSEMSSLDIDFQNQRVKKKNPYSYHIGTTGYFKRLIQLCENKRCRRALLSAAVSMISQQMTGVNAIALLSTIVWTNSIVADDSNNLKDSAQTAAIIGLAFGAANYIFGLPAYWLSDRVGRSIMLALGLPNMAWSMLVCALLFQIPHPSVRTPMTSIFAIIFVFFYSPTAGTSPFSISAEVFPLGTLSGLHAMIMS